MCCLAGGVFAAFIFGLFYLTVVRSLCVFSYQRYAGAQDMSTVRGNIEILVTQR